jgi:hypothetical protein
MFEHITNQNITLTRYVSFTKFVATLEQGLFIPKATLFEDKLEGMMPFLNAAECPKSFNSSSIQPSLEWQYVSCWHESNHECHAMWKIYGHGVESVAFQTTINKLKTAFWKLPAKYGASLDRVRYINPEEFKLKDLKGGVVISRGDPVGGFPSAFAGISLFSKHHGFEFEKEVRLIATDNDANSCDINPTSGIYIQPEHTRSMIQKIFIHPYAPPWFETLVKSITKAKYGMDIEITKSSLSTPDLTGQ